MKEKRIGPTPKLKVESHPFNPNVGSLSYGPNTTRIIIGSFPAYEVINKKSPRMNFYYGSRENKFWDLLKEALGADFELSRESILNYIRNNDLGVIDMIEKSYRRDNRSSKDSDLTIVEQLDFIDLLQQHNCRNFYTTSKLVTTLIIKQLKPVSHSMLSTIREYNGFPYLELSFRFLPGGKEYKINIFTLLSPGPNGLRGIQKGLNAAGRTDILADEYRRLQYSSLLVSFNDSAIVDIKSENLK